MNKPVERDVIGHLYVSLPFFGHKVFKYHTQLTNRILYNGMTHAEYYTELLKHTVPTDSNHFELSYEEALRLPERFQVLVFPVYKGDRIFEDGTPYKD